MASVEKIKAVLGGFTYQNTLLRAACNGTSKGLFTFLYLIKLRTKKGRHNYYYNYVVTPFGAMLRSSLLRI